MDVDLIDRLWGQALHEGKGVRGVGHRMAALVAEECAKEIERACAYSDWNDEGRGVVDSIRETFGRHETRGMVGR